MAKHHPVSRPGTRNFKPVAVARKPGRSAPSPSHRRPPSERLTSLISGSNVTRLNLPRGCFNAGLIAIPGEARYVCVYRPNEHAFVSCILDATLNIVGGSEMPLGLTNCADPRLVWTPAGELLMVYSSYDTGTYKMECIRGAVIGVIDPLTRTYLQREAQPFRISLPGETRQKNWMPFVADGRVYLTASVRPHLVYELTEIGRFATPVSEAAWDSPWFNDQFLRGNTNHVQLADGNFLGTYHTAVRADTGMHYYDNGCYVFEPKPPFRVLRAGNRTYLPAEAAVEPHFRKAGIIKVCFPCGMVREGERLLISYGDNDSSVKILDTTVAEMLQTTLTLY